MRRLLTALSLGYAAGAVGGLINSLAVWASGHYGITAAIGVKTAPDLTTAWLYPRLVWGGIWGLLLILPLLSRRPILRGILVSIPPTLAQLFVVFPYHLQKGLMGMSLGKFTPLTVIIFNIIWGVAASIWFSRVGESSSRWK
jgi:hypothetical protein